MIVYVDHSKHIDVTHVLSRAHLPLHPKCHCRQTSCILAYMCLARVMSKKCDFVGGEETKLARHTIQNIRFDEIKVKYAILLGTNGKIAPGVSSVTIRGAKCHERSRLLGTSLRQRRTMIAMIRFDSILSRGRNIHEYKYQY